MTTSKTPTTPLGRSQLEYMACSSLSFALFALPVTSTGVNVILSVADQLVKVGAEMLVVMGGFVAALYSLFKTNMTYGEVESNESATSE